MAKPNAASLPPRSVVMPMTAPLASTSGPPDHDASMGSSVWIRPWSDSPSVSRRRSTALDVAGGDRRFAVRFGRPAERDRRSTHGEVGGGPEDRNREVAGVDGDDGDVGGEVRAEDLALEPTSISELHGHRGRAGHLVGAGEHQAVVPDHDPRGGRRAVLVGHDQVDDGGTELLGQGREARLVLEDRVGDHWRHRHLLHHGLLRRAWRRCRRPRGRRRRGPLPPGPQPPRPARRTGVETSSAPAGGRPARRPAPSGSARRDGARADRRGERWTDASPLVVGIVVRGHGSRR